MIMIYNASSQKYFRRLLNIAQKLFSIIVLVFNCHVTTFRVSGKALSMLHFEASYIRPKIITSRSSVGYYVSFLFP